MSTPQYNRNRGSLFENDAKRKPSHADLQGECAIDGATYDMQAWRRDDAITLTIAPARGDRNTYPPDALRGELEPEPRSKGRGDDATPTWVGEMVGDEQRYTVRAEQKQGKSGKYLSLYFVRSTPS